MRHENLLTSDNCLLLVVDIQDAFAPHIAEMDRVIERSRIMIEAASLLDVPIIATEQYPKGLGPTVEPLRNVLQDCIPYEKTTFSCCNDDTINSAILATGRRQILLVGIEAHVCISQTAHDLIAQGLQCHLAADAVSSRRLSDHRVALDRLAQAGAIITSTEAAMMEMTAHSRHQNFRQISQLIK